MIRINLKVKYPRKKWEKIERRTELKLKISLYNKFSSDIVDIDLEIPVTEDEIKVIRKNRKARKYYRKNEAKKKAQAQKRYWRNQIGKAKALNVPFKGCNAHHISDYYVVYIPRELHQKHPHSLKNYFRMDVINNAVIEWLVLEEKNDVALLVKEHLRFLRKTNLLL